MPIMTETLGAGGIVGVLPAAAGLRVEAYAPAGADTGKIPTPAGVVAWAQITDPGSAGGVRIDPVFLAQGRTWTPDQFRAAWGERLELKVVPA